MKLIIFTLHYNGYNSGEQAGFDDAEAKALVDAKLARFVNPEVEEAEEPEDDDESALFDMIRATDYQPAQLAKLKKAELIELAKTDFDVDLSGTKDEIIAAIGVAAEAKAKAELEKAQAGTGGQGDGSGA